jgi:DNA polymerase I-like protein with 3'-5' exonuclease and polymerase domains
MKPISIDTEASYETGRDIKSLGVANYVRHPDTDHFLVTAYGENHAAAADPREFQWDPDAMWVSHNAQYDSQVIAEYRRRGISVPVPREWNCSADLAAYLQSPRALADASRELLGIELDKSVRDEMKGRNFRTLSKEDQLRWITYGLLDAKASYLLWQQHAHKWPEHERAISRHTAMMGARGIGIDSDRVVQGIELAKQAKWEAEQQIPWSSELNAKGKEIPITSPKRMAEECRRVGIEPPSTTEAKSEIFAAWLEENADKAGFVQAMQSWRRANRLLTVLEAMRARSRDNRLFYSLKYFGAATGRWSGDAGLNCQNLPRSPFAGVNTRACLVPGPGKKFVIADLAQIEPRVLNWMVGNERWLELVRSGMGPYEAHGRTVKNWTGGNLKKEDPAMYLNCKVEVLGLGYGAGAAQYQRIAKTMGGLVLTEAEAKRAVDQFRRGNRKIVAMWDQLDRGVRSSRGGDFEMELPSGRTIKYMNVAATGKDTTARTAMGGARYRWWGSKLAENACQAVARDVFADMVLRLEAAGLPVVLTVHDEAVLEVDADSADDAKAEAIRIMSTPPAWCHDLPVGAEAHIADCYGK